jgi:hypothetical protein
MTDPFFEQQSIGARQRFWSERFSALDDTEQQLVAQSRARIDSSRRLLARTFRQLAVAAAAIRRQSELASWQTKPSAAS